MPHIQKQRVRGKEDYHIEYLKMGLPCGDCPLATRGFHAAQRHVGCNCGGFGWVPYALAKRCIVPNYIDALVVQFPGLVVQAIGGIDLAAQALDAIGSAYLDILKPVPPPDPTG